MRRHDETRAATSAVEQARQGPLWAPLLIEMGTAALGAPALHELPRAVVDDTQLGGCLPVPLAFRILA